MFVEQWPAHVEAMRAHGVTIHMPERTITVPVRTLHLCEVATLRERFDVVLLLVKAYDTRWATHLIAPHLADDGLLAGVQNGMTTAGRGRGRGPGAHGRRRHRDHLGDDRRPASSTATPAPTRSWFAVGGLDARDGGARARDRRAPAPQRRRRRGRRHRGREVDEARQQRDDARHDRHPRAVDGGGRGGARDARADAALGPGGPRRDASPSATRSCPSSACAPRTWPSRRRSSRPCWTRC